MEIIKIKIIIRDSFLKIFNKKTYDLIKGNFSNINALTRFFLIIYFSEFKNLQKHLLDEGISALFHCGKLKILIVFFCDKSHEQVDVMVFEVIY